MPVRNIIASPEFYKTTLITDRKADFHGICILNVWTSGVTCIISDANAAGTTNPIGSFIAKAQGGVLDNVFFPPKPIRCTNGIAVQLLDGGTNISGVSAVVYW